jgi:hypothetical protein
MTIFTYENLYKAYLDCRKSKRKTANALKFELDLEHKLHVLLQELKTGTYYPGRSICFVVTKPCPREIFAADFRDRIVHHLLVREIIKAGEKKFIFDSYACRKNKGTHKAVARVSQFIRIVSNNYKQEAHYLQLDIKSFFMTIDQEILFKILKKMINSQKRDQIWKNEILNLAQKIIFHKPQENYFKKGKANTFDLIPKHKSLFHQKSKKGLPIGNYSSQFFANLYLNELDQFIKKHLKQRFYLRYVDDFIILGKDKLFLQNLIEKVNEFLKNNLSLELNYAKIKLEKVNRGLDFLGYFIKPCCPLIRKKVLNNFYDKVCFEENKKQAMKSINAYWGHFRFV